MSDLDTSPREQVCRSAPAAHPEELLITARRVPLGKTAEVARALPDRQIRMIGAWCFLDHYGPEELGRSAGMQVWAHPHTGLQTVSWLLEGEVEHRDSLGSRARVRPGELNIMTAGHGIVHSEISPPDRPPRLHGAQLWLALPDGVRDIAPRFEAYADLPDLVLGAAAGPAVRGKLLLGALAGRRAPATTHSRLCGADLIVEPGTTATVDLDPTFEYGAFVVAGTLRVEATTVGVDQLLYLGAGRTGIRLASEQGGRMILLGGEPFGAEIVMWWNFIGRSHEEIVAFRSAWADRDVRFPPVISREEKVMEAPPMPSVALKPRPARRMGT